MMKAAFVLPMISYFEILNEISKKICNSLAEKWIYRVSVI